MPMRFSFSPSEPEKSRKSSAPAPTVKRIPEDDGSGNEFRSAPLTIEARFHCAVARSVAGGLRGLNMVSYGMKAYHCFNCVQPDPSRGETGQS
jgi:hypothetical protein